MQHNHPLLVRTRQYLDNGLVAVEIIALIATGLATTVAIATEIWIMIDRGSVTLADLLLMFLYLEVLAMIGQYLRTGQIQVRFPLYIAMVALARYLIIEVKEIEEMRILAISGSILLLTLAVLVIRYGHRTFPYSDLGSAAESDTGTRNRFMADPSAAGADHSSTIQTPAPLSADAVQQQSGRQQAVDKQAVDKED